MKNQNANARMTTPATPPTTPPTIAPVLLDEGSGDGVLWRDALLVLAEDDAEVAVGIDEVGDVETNLPLSR